MFLDLPGLIPSPKRPGKSGFYCIGKLSTSKFGGRSPPHCSEMGKLSTSKYEGQPSLTSSQRWESCRPPNMRDGLLSLLRDWEVVDHKLTYELPADCCEYLKGLLKMVTRCTLRGGGSYIKLRGFVNRIFRFLITVLMIF